MVQSKEMGHAEYSLRHSANCQHTANLARLEGCEVHRGSEDTDQIVRMTVAGLKRLDY
jgi:hypothetical protein